MIDEYAEVERQLRQKTPAAEADRFMRTRPRIEVLRGAINALPKTKQESIEILRDSAGLSRQRIIHAPVAQPAPNIPEEQKPLSVNSEMRQA